MSQRDDLLAAARKLLAEKGYDRTTARDLATAAGAHLGSIGYHFGSKDALMTQATLQAQGEWGAIVDHAVAQADASTPTQRLQVCIDTLSKAINAQPEIIVASTQAIAKAGLDEEIRDTLADVNADARTDFAALALGIPKETVQADQARSLGSLVHAIVIGLSIQLMIDPQSAPTGADLATALQTLTTPAKS